MVQNIFVVGVSYKTAPIDQREKVFFRPAERELFLNMLKNDPSYVEGLMISTCNRTEVYVHAISSEVNKDKVIDLILQIKKVPLDDVIRDTFYFHSAEDSLRHLLRVITGLDSIVLGEKQILGQVKEAIELSRAKGMFQKMFNVMSDLVIRAGKKAQRDTDISCGGGSVSWAAVKSAQDIMKSLTNKKVLIIGAGKMSALTADQLRNKQLAQVYIMNRTKEKAVALAEKLGGEVASFMDIKEILSKVDFCICSASAPHYLIGLDLMRKVMQNRDFNSLLLIDISTPRTIDPSIKQVKNIQLLAIDDLEKAVQENMDKRKAAIELVEKIINGKISEFYIKISKMLKPALVSSDNKYPDQI